MEEAQLPPPSPPQHPPPLQQESMETRLLADRGRSPQRLATSLPPSQHPPLQHESTETLLFTDGMGDLRGRTLAGPFEAFDVVQHDCSP